MGLLHIGALAGKYRLICLARKSVIRHSDVEIVQGDITQPRFGLHESQFDAIARRIDWIVHSAAITRLDGDSDEIHRANVVGTQQVLELAARSGKPLYHISTAFTHDCDYFEGVVPATSYEFSKRLAEQLVRRSGLPVTIFRPSIIIGDAATGVMPGFQGFHLTVGLVFSGVLPIVPCPAQARVDVIARDVAALAIKMALDRELIGGDFFLTSGDKAPTVDKIVDLLAGVARENGVLFARPRCMHPDIFERLIKPVFLPSVAGELQAALLRAASMCRYVSLRTQLPSNLLELLPEDVGHGRDATVELQRSIEFMQPRLAAFSRMAKLARSKPRRSCSDEPEFA